MREKISDTEKYTTSSAKLAEVIKELGFNNLKKGQDEAIHNLLMGRDTICFLPTGGGKSAIYQIPTRCHGWKTLVFCPLVSLMQDQVESLWSAEYKANQISSGQSSAENDNAMCEWERGDLDFLLVAPERLGSERFHQVISRIPPNFVVVDEAHCISQWADSFRPDYQKIGEFVEQYCPDTILALTATATKEVEQDIREKLGIPRADRIIFFPSRKNLNFVTKDYSVAEFKKDINTVKGSVVVYCATRKRTEEMYALFAQHITGDALVYHGGMDSDARSSNQSLFMTGKVRVMFATNAFGLGIDKSDIRGVFHRDFPKSLEDYVQESGRSGRDGGESSCIFYTDNDSLKTQKWFIDTTFPTRDIVTRVYNYLKRSADSDNIVKLTNTDLARKVGVHEAYISSTVGVMIGAKVIERPKNQLKTFKLKILKSHVDARYLNVFSVIEEIGILGDDEFYEVDINFACDRIGKKMATVKAYLKTLHNEGYVEYIPPFRGVPTKILGDLSKIDFQHLSAKAEQSYKKLQKLVEFCEVPDESKHAFLQNYFLKSET